MLSTRLWPARLLAGKSVAVMLWIENATSAEVKGVPSCHLTPGRSLIDQVSPSSDKPPLATVGTSSAKRGSISPLGATAQSGL